MPGSSREELDVVDLAARDHRRGARSWTEKTAPLLSLGDSAEIVAKTLKILAPKASLERDGDASLKGKKVALDCDAVGDAKQAADAMLPGQTRTFKLTVKDPDLTPCPNKHDERLGDGKKYEGDTGGDGSIEQNIPKESSRATLTVWNETWPTGKQLSWSFEYDDPPPPGSLKGAQIRLKNGEDRSLRDQPGAEHVRSGHGRH